MTDLYLRREEPSKRPIVIAVSILVVLVLALAVYHLRTHAQRAAQAAPDTVQAEPSPSAPPPAVAAPAPEAPPAIPPPGPSASLQESAPPPAPPPRTNLLADARRLRDEGKLLEARKLCLEALGNPATPATARAEAEALAGSINTTLAFTPRDMPGKETYVVKPGDSLDRIARNYHTTVDLVRESNGITGSLIHPGDRLRILTGTFSMTVDKSDNTLVLYHDGLFFKRYRVGTGAHGKTPVGTFKITDKIKDPPWWRPDGKQIPYGDPDNLLGTRWLSLNIRGYGLHGTWEPESIGKQASAGCVRLLNSDVEEIFTLVPVGTPVIVED